MFLWGIFCHVNEQNLRNWKSDKNISCYSSTNFPLEALDSHIQRDNANSITTMCSLVEIIIARLGNNTTFTASSQLLWMCFEIDNLEKPTALSTGRHRLSKKCNTPRITYLIALTSVTVHIQSTYLLKHRGLSGDTAYSVAAMLEVFCYWQQKTKKTKHGSILLMIHWWFCQKSVTVSLVGLPPFWLKFELPFHCRKNWIFDL